MKTTFYTHPANLKHQTPAGHAEKPERIEAVLDALDGPEFQDLIRKQAPKATREHLLLVHEASYVDQILQAKPGPGETLALDPDTYLSVGSAEAALRGVGAVISAVDDVMAGNTHAAFCATRPPGHHARPSSAMGFCIFSNIAIAARYAQEQYGLGKVAVIDFDVHHGNGTQEALWDQPGTLFVSLHQKDHYPGTGLASETGGQGKVLNVPMAAGTSAADWMQKFDTVVMPQLESFIPELILVSAGFDAHRDDPLGGFLLEDHHFGQLGVKLAKMSQTYAKSRLVSVLEGGYDLPSLGRASAHFVRGLQNA